MEEKSLPRLNSILVSFIILLGGVLIAILILLLTIAPPRPGDFVSDNIWAWLFVPIFLIFFLEMIYSRLKKDLAIREEKIQYNDGGIWSTLALALQYLGIIKGIFSIIFLLVLFGFFSYITPIRDIFSKGVVLSGQFYLLAVVYVVYIIIRLLFKRSTLRSSASKMGASISSSAAKNLPKYKVMKEGLIIDLNFKGLGKMKDKDWTIKVGFEEVDELREMTWVESDAFVKHTIGPNAQLQWQQSKDMYNYAKGKIDKPSVYISTALNQTNKVIFMKGRNLFYLVSFDSPDVSDILLAYKKYKMQR